MIPAPFEYARAKSVGEAVRALAAKDGTRLIAGGQSLIPLLRFRMLRPPRLLDIGGLEELRGVKPARGGVRIGGATPYTHILDAPLVKERLPLLVEVLGHVGDLATRNRGTIGGGLAHADPSMDTPAALLALGAEINVRSTQGTRTVPAREWFRGPYLTALRDDELLTDIVVPFPPARSGSAYVAFEQAASGYPLAAAAAVLVRSRGTITAAALAFTGVGPTPFLSEAAASLVGTKGTAGDFERVAAAALVGVEVSADIHAPEAYRRQLALVAARRALAGALARTG